MGYKSHDSNNHLLSSNIFREEISFLHEIYDVNEIYNILEKIPVNYVILDDQRQIVYGNKNALSLFGNYSLNDILGQRLGDVLECIYSKKNLESCGVSESCKSCKLLNSTIKSLNNESTNIEIRLERFNSQIDWDLKIWTDPLVINHKKYVAVTIHDIKLQKTKMDFDKIFFHDIINTLQLLMGAIDSLKHDNSSTNTEDNIAKVDKITKNLVFEIKSQRTLSQIQENEFILQRSKFNLIELIGDIIAQFQFRFIHHKILFEGSDKITLKSDKTILRRILVNLLKNAIEASSETDPVNIGVRSGKKIKIWVKNKSEIPKNIVPFLFQKPVSSKRPDRGYGTYSIKLLTDILGGEVSFTSSPEKGTEFILELPLENN